MEYITNSEIKEQILADLVAKRPDLVSDSAVAECFELFDRVSGDSELNATVPWVVDYWIICKNSGEKFDLVLSCWPFPTDKIPD